MYAPYFATKHRHLLAIFIIFLIPIIVLFDFRAFQRFTSIRSIPPELSQIPNHLIESILPSTTFTSSSASRSSQEWKPPSSSDQQLDRYNRENQFTKDQLQYPWTRPLVYLYSARPSYQNDSETELYLYGQGLLLGHKIGFQRNFTIAGCLVGSTVYPLNFHAHADVFMCVIPHRIKAGEFLSLAIMKDEYLERALTLQPVQLAQSLNITLEEGDLNPVPKDYQIYPQVQFRTNGADLYYARSIVNFQNNHEWLTEKDRKEKTRYEICGCTQNKLYPHLTEPWVDYHRRIGMDFMYVIDNNATEDLQKTFADRSDVGVYFWPYGKSQVQIWTYILQMAQAQCEWLLLFDPDEYMMHGLGKNMEYAHAKPLKRYVKRLRTDKTFAVAIHYTELVSSGQEKIPDDPPPKVYVHLRKNHNDQCKMLVQTDYPWSVSGVHRQNGEYNRYLHNIPGLLETKGGPESKPMDVDEDPSLVHFQTRSWEEVLMKQSNPSSALTDTIGLWQNKQPTRPPTWFVRKHDDSLEYTHFRSIWEAVTKEADMESQTLVRITEGKRCTARVRTSDKLVTEETCESVVSTKEESRGGTRR